MEIMELREKLLKACIEINKLGISPSIDISLATELVIYDFTDAVEQIDDEGKVDDLPENVIDLYGFVIFVFSTFYS